MIESFRHKGLKAFAETGDKRGILPGHAERIGEILSALESARTVKDVLRVKGFHSLRIRGDKRPTHYAMSVSGAWRITFTVDSVEPLRTAQNAPAGTSFAKPRAEREKRRFDDAGEPRFRCLDYCNYH